LINIEFSNVIQIGKIESKFAQSSSFQLIEFIKFLLRKFDGLFFLLRGVAIFDRLLLR